MLTALIPTIAKVVVSTSAGVAIDSAVKMIVPLGMKAFPAYSIKVGTAIASALIGAKIGKLVETNVIDVMATVQSVEAPEVPVQEDN